MGRAGARKSNFLALLRFWYWGKMGAVPKIGRDTMENEMEKITGFNSVAFCREVDGILMQESVRQEGRTADGMVMYVASHNALSCIFTDTRGKNNWTKQGRKGVEEFTKLIGRELAWNQEALC